jgi:hypothetical protein
MLEKQPVVTLYPLATSRRETYLVIRIIAFREILKDAASLKDPDLLAIRK